MTGRCLYCGKAAEGDFCSHVCERRYRAYVTRVEAHGILYTLGLILVLALFILPLFVGHLPQIWGMGVMLLGILLSLMPFAPSSVIGRIGAKRSETALMISGYVMSVTGAVIIIVQLIRRGGPYGTRTSSMRSGPTVHYFRHSSQQNSIINGQGLTSLMSKCPFGGEGHSLMRGLLSGRCLAAVLMVAVLAVSCFVLINDSDDSSATNAQRVYITLPGGDDPNSKHYLEDGDSDIFHSSEYSISYNNGVLSLHDSSSNEYSFYDCYNIDGVGLVALYADGDLVLEISGSTPELRFCTYSNDTSLARYGIYVTGNLTIRNTGDVDRTIKTLNHSSTGTTNHSEVGSTGIYCGGSLTIQNNSTHSFTINANASDKQTDTIETFSSYGIRAAYNITVKDTILNVSGGKAINTSAGIYCGNNLSVTNTKFDSLSVTASGSDCMNADATSFYSYGIYAVGNVSFTDVSVTATGGQACRVSAGIHSGGLVSATKDNTESMSLQATGSKNIYTNVTNRGGYSSFGVDATYINFTDVDVTATAADITNAPNCSDGGLIKSIGIYCNGTGDVNTISGKTTVTASGGSIDASTYKNGAYPVETAGMHVGKLNINLDSGDYTVTSAGGDVYFQTGASNKGGISYGIFAATITNLTGRVTADGGIAFLPVGCANAESYGIYSSGSIVGNGCTVTATASDATRISCGVYASSFDSGVNGEITCTAGFVYGLNGGDSFGLEVSNDYIGRAGSNVVCRAGVSCYNEVRNAGVYVSNITLNGDAVLEGYGGEVRLAYTSETQYQTSVFHVTSGNGTDSHGVWMFGDITVNGTSRLEGVGGEIITQASHNGSHCTYGIYMNPAAGDYSISGTGTVVAKGGDTKYGHGSTMLDNSVGLYCGGDLTISQAIVTATGGSVCTYVNTYSTQQKYNGSSSVGMMVGSLSLSDSANVTAGGGDNIAHSTNNTGDGMPFYNDSYGAYISGALSVSASTLNAIAGKASRMAGLYVLGGITVTGNSNVDAVADSSKRAGYVRADSNGFTNSAYGIAIGSSDESADISVTGSILMATGDVAIQAKSASTSGNKIIATYIVTTLSNSVTLTETEKTFASIPSSDCVLATYEKATVTFNGNEGGGSMAPRSELGSMTLPSCGFTAPYGKSFAGWAINEPSGTLKSPESRIIVLSDTTLYAVWNDVPRYDVSFVKDDGINIYVKIGGDERRELTDDEITAGKISGILRGTTVYFTAQPIDGYDVYYQVSDDDQSFIMGTCTIGVTEDCSVTFTKVPQKYTIIWKSQDGSTVLETDTEVEYGATLSFNAAAPTKENTEQFTYAFVGWALESYSTAGTPVGDLPTAYSNMTYFAAFSETVNIYAVTWKSQDGNSVLSTKNYEYGRYAEFDSTQPEKENNAQYTYEFVGWATEANQTTGKSMVEYPYVTGETIYYAAFSETVNTYTVTWHAQDGTVLETDADVEYGTAPSYDDAQPTKENTAQYTYVFAGWATEANQTTGTAVADLPDVEGDVDYYAAFSETVNTYVVTWKSQDGTAILETDSNVSYGTHPSFDKETPVKENSPQYAFAFAGWATEANQTTGTAVADLPDVEGNVTYYAAFSGSVRTYTVTWHAQNGTVLETDTDVPYGDPVSFDGSEPTKDNDAHYTYAFAGWATEAGQKAGTPAGDLPAVSGDADYYAAFSETVNTYTVTLTEGTGYVIAPYGTSTSPVDYGGSFSFTVTHDTGYEGTLVVEANDTTITAVDGVYTVSDIAENITVTVTGAQLKKLTVTFHRNGGTSGEMSEQIVDYNTPTDLALNAFSYYGYSFNGWNTDHSGTGIAYADGAQITITEDITLYARWTPKELTITLNPNSGTVSPTSLDITYNTNYELPIPIYAGHNFAGWWIESTPQQLINNSGKWTVREGDITLVAHWTELTTYDMTFSGGAGSEGSMGEVPVVEGENFTLPSCTFTKTGYHFYKWSYNAVEYDAGATIEDVTEDMEFLALWEGNMHMVTVHYVYAENLAPMRDDIVQEHRFGETYEIYSDIIAGYTADKSVVSGTMGDENLEVTVKYAMDAEFVVSDGDVIGFVGDGDSVVIDLGNPSVASAMADATKTTVEVSGNGWTMDIPKEILSGATGTVSVSAKVLDDAAKAALPAAIQERIAGKTIYSLDLSGGSGAIGFGGKKVKVTLPYELAAGKDASDVKVFFINGAELVQYDAAYDSVKKVAVFETDHFSDWFVDIVESPTSSGNSDKGGFPIWIVFVILAVVIVGGGAAAFFVMKNKKA